jgi:hypothetical protein
MRFAGESIPGEPLPSAAYCWTKGRTEQILRSIKQIAAALLLSIAVIALLLFISHLVSKPPKESKFIENFYNHRAAYEQLRGMLLADSRIAEVADWGVRTTDETVSSKPPYGGLSIDRYHQYLTLLGQIGAKGVSCSKGQESEVRVLLWASGFGADTRHVAISWLDREPINTALSLDEFYKTPKPRNPLYVRIDRNWYIWADW